MILPEYVADTNALLWYLLRSSNLGANALAAFRSASQGQAQIVLPSMVLAEFYYAIIKHKMPLNFAQELARLQSAAQFVFVDFKATDTLLFDQLAIIPEMHDRIRIRRRRSRTSPRGAKKKTPMAKPICVSVGSSPACFTPAWRLRSICASRG